MKSLIMESELWALPHGSRNYKVATNYHLHGNTSSWIVCWLRDNTCGSPLFLQSRLPPFTELNCILFSLATHNKDSKLSLLGYMLYLYALKEKATQMAQLNFLGLHFLNLKL